MRILHLFGWKLKDIISYLPMIENQGFDSVQVGPLQPIKEPDNNSWWIYYQQCGFYIGNNLGSKEDLTLLCNEAKKYNVRVFCDVVCNHVAGKNDGTTEPHENVDPKLRLNPNVWKERREIVNHENRYEATHFSMKGLPGLDTSKVEVQDMIIDFLNEMIDCGVDGFRFDAAKYIALPGEGSDFWPRVIYNLKKYGLYLYCEVIFSSTWLIDQYCQYLNVLTNGYGSNMDKIVSFVESHDSYLEFKYTKVFSSMDIAYRYRDLARVNQNTIFYVRPFDNTWMSSIVKEANMYGKDYTKYTR